MFELNTERLWKMSYEGIMRKISWSFRSKRIKQLLSFAIEKIEYLDDGVSLFKRYNGYFDLGQEAKFKIVMKRLMRGHHEFREVLFDITQDISWLQITPPPDDLSFCMLMIQSLPNDSKAARNAYEKAKELVFSGKKIDFWDLYELYQVKKSKALWNRVWKQLNKEDNLWFGSIEKILKETGKKDVLSLWMSKAEDINTWNKILRACPKRLRWRACQGIADYYQKLAEDPKLYKRNSL